MEVVVTIGAIRRAKLQSNHHHQQTNTQCFTGRMPPDYLCKGGPLWCRHLKVANQKYNGSSSCNRLTFGRTNLVRHDILWANFEQRWCGTDFGPERPSSGGGAIKWLRELLGLPVFQPWCDINTRWGECVSAASECHSSRRCWNIQRKPFNL